MSLIKRTNQNTNKANERIIRARLQSLAIHWAEAEDDITRLQCDRTAGEYIDDLFKGTKDYHLNRMDYATLYGNEKLRIRKVMRQDKERRAAMPREVLREMPSEISLSDYVQVSA